MKRALIVFTLIWLGTACSGGQISPGAGTEDSQHRGGRGNPGDGGQNPTPPTTDPNATADPNASNPNSAGPANAPTTPQTIRVVNKCSYTVWLGTLSGGGSISNPPAQPALAQGAQVDLNLSAGWSGRVWGRTGCTFDGSGQGTCATGDCGGQEVCTGTGEPPATLAEFTLGGAGGQTFYDVSLVDGFNVPMQVQPANPNGTSGSCGAPSCAANLNTTCPQPLQVVDGSGNVIACQSACDAMQTPQACCTGAFDTSQTCSPTSYAQGFKSQCPSAYSYAFDDQTSTFTCGQNSFLVTFCP